MVEIFNPQEYVEFIKSCPFILIHVWAEWNAYDYQMKTKLKEIETAYSNRVCFGSIDVDIEAMRQILKDIKINNVPALVYYKKSVYLETIIGLNQPIEDKLNSLLAEA